MKLKKGISAGLLIFLKLDYLNAPERYEFCDILFNHKDTKKHEEILKTIAWFNNKAI